MLLLHEHLEREAAEVKRVLESVFGFPVVLRGESLERYLPAIRDARWPGSDYNPAWDLLRAEYHDTAVMLLTARDLYDFGPDREPSDVWLFGVMRAWRHHSMLSVARLRTTDGKPLSPAVDDATYLRRLGLMAIHEIGHDVLGETPHYREAAWVEAGSEEPKDELGAHCDDNTCSMYEVVDVETPPREEGWLGLGDGKGDRS